MSDFLLEELRRDETPRPALHTLERHAAEVLAAAGAPPIDAASRLGEDSNADDRATVATLRAASQALSAAAEALVAARASGPDLHGELQTALSRVEATPPSPVSPDRAGMAEQQRWRTELLLAVDRFGDAQRAIDRGLDVARRTHQNDDATAWQLLRCRSHVEAGRLVDAAEAFDGVISVGDVDVTDVSEAAALQAQAVVAIHTSDAGRSRTIAAIARRALAGDLPDVRHHVACLLAMQAMATGEPAEARRLLIADSDATRDLALPLRYFGASNAPQLVRLGLAARDADLSQTAVELAETRSRHNPGIASLAGAAAHARGLHTGDASALAEAEQHLAAGPRRLALASAVEDHGRLLLLDDDRAGAIRELGRALQLYAAAGAAWDASRVRRRLRRLGVRRRLVRPARPATGWAGLTDAELLVVRLAAEGLTNRTVADRLFLSPHTVSMHLRHVYTKLGIRSRVELARLTMEHEPAA